MPVVWATKSRIARTRALLNLMSSGWRDAGLSAGSEVTCLACSRICSIRGFGRAASMRSLIFRCTRRTFAESSPFNGS